MGKCCYVCIQVALITTIVLLVLLGAFLLLILPSIVTDVIKEQDYLGRDRNGSYNMVLERFRLPPYKIAMQVWTFSVQNQDAVLAGTEKPKIVEKGPYVFTVKMEKNNLEFDKNDTILFYKQTRSFFFNQSLSCANCSLTDIVVIPNLIFQKFVDIATDNPWTRLPIDLALSGLRETVFKEVSVDELLFKGYEDPIITPLCRFLKHLCDAYSIPGRIGLFYGQNNTDDGRYEIDTGRTDTNKLATVYSWNGMRQLSDKYWYGQGARVIQGTDAELFPPGLSDRTDLEIFIGQLCRTFKLEKDDTVCNYAQNVPVNRYGMSKSMHDVALQKSLGFCNPNSPMYFVNSTAQEEGCAPSGIQDMSTCLPGNPRIYISQPHFKGSPDELREAIEGMPPAMDDDLSVFNIEPITGVIVEVQQRQQLNLGMLKGNLQTTKNMNNTIFPIIWLNESAIIDPETREQIMVAVSLVKTSFTVGIGLCIIGVLLVFAPIGLSQWRKKRASQQELTTPLVQEEQPIAVEGSNPFLPNDNYVPS